MIPIYIRSDLDGAQWCVEDPEAIQQESLVLKDILRKMIYIMWSTALDLNDPITRKSVADRGNAYLNERCVSRLISDGKVICDESNNSPATLDKQIIVTVCIKRFDGVGYNQFSLSDKPLGVQR